MPVEENKEDIELLFKKMMMDSGEKSPKDMIYLEDMKDVGIFKVQWKICGVQGYQIYENDKISYKFGELLEEPDVTLEILDRDLAIQFLKGEHFSTRKLPIFSRTPDDIGNFRINHTEGWKITETEKGKRRERITKPFLTIQFNRKKNYHPYIITKLPIFRSFVNQRTGEEYGSYIARARAINKSLGEFLNEIIPYKIFKHFIDKASNIVMLPVCPCRTFNDCQNHDKSIGCVWMGDDTKKILIPQDSRLMVVTKKEALERVKLAIDDGLIPLLGRASDEPEGQGVQDTGHWLSMCFCCPCCCINGRIVRFASKGHNIFGRMEGITVTVDKDICVGCGSCLEVCVFKGMEMIDGIAQVNQEQCLGCGKCESTCPNEAISISIDDPSRVDEIINKIESHVEAS